MTEQTSKLTTPHLNGQPALGYCATALPSVRGVVSRKAESLKCREKSHIPLSASTIPPRAHGLFLF